MTKPIHALTAYVPTDVWYRLPPRSRQCAPGVPTALPTTPPPPLRPSPSWFCPEYRFCSGRMWRLVWGFIHICDGFDTWQRKYADGGEWQEICLRSHVWERWPHRVNMNEGEKLMLLPLLPLSLLLSLALSVIYSHFIHWAHNPCGSSVRPGKCRVRAATHEYDCPLCLLWCKEIRSVL